MSVPTRLTKGISTSIKGTITGDLPFPDPFHTGSGNFDVYAYVNDYIDIGTTTLNTITGTSSTFNLTNGTGGIALLTPGGASTVSTVARAFTSCQFISGQKFWYVARVASSGVGAGVITRFGLQNGTGANTTNDSIYFTKVTGASGGVNLVSTVATVATTLVTGVLASTTAAGWVDVGFYYDGTDLLVYANDLPIARIANPTIGASGQTLTNTALTPFFQITPTATDTLSIDYVMAAQEMSR
jgi:hypothetical protein